MHRTQPGPPQPLDRHYLLRVASDSDEDSDDNTELLNADTNDRANADEEDPNASTFTSCRSTGTPPVGYTALGVTEGHSAMIPTMMAPRDRFHLAYGIFFLLGAGMLFPWNVFITANDYFRYRFTGSPFDANFQNYFSVASMGSNVMGLGMTLALGSRVASPHKRTWISLLIVAIAFLLCCAMTLEEHVDPYVSFYMALSMVLVCGLSVAFLQGGVFGTASMFPPIYTQAIMSGQGLAATIVALTQIATKATGVSEHSSEKSLRTSTFLYFLLSFMVIVACLGGWFLLRRLDIFRYYVQRQVRLVADEEDMIIDHGDVIKEDAAVVDVDVLAIGDDDARASLYNTNAASIAIEGQINRWLVLKRIAPLAFAVFLDFAVTLMLHPALTSSVATTSSSPSFSGYFIAVMFLVFALGDWLGKSLPGFPPLLLPALLFGRRADGSRRQWTYATIRSPSLIVGMSIARLAFIPLLLATNVMLDATTPLPRPHWLPPLLLPNDFAFYLIIALFAITNGWLGSIAMMNAPGLCGVRARAEEKEMAGTIMVFFLTLGLAAGSVLSFGLRHVLCGCNPFVG